MRPSVPSWPYLQITSPPVRRSPTISSTALAIGYDALPAPMKRTRPCAGRGTIWPSIRSASSSRVTRSRTAWYGSEAASACSMTSSAKARRWRSPCDESCAALETNWRKLIAWSERYLEVLACVSSARTQLALDLEQPVVFGCSLASHRRTRLDLAGIQCDGDVSDDRVLGLARALGHHDAVAAPVGEIRSVQGLRQGPDLVYLPQHRVGGPRGDAFSETFGV